MRKVEGASRRKKRLVGRVLFVQLLVACSSLLSAQCTTGVDGGPLPALTSTYQILPVVTGTYYTFNAPLACSSFDFTFCTDGGESSFSSKLTITNSTGTSIDGFQNFGCAGGVASINNWSPPSSGVYRVYVNEDDCTVVGSTATLAYREQDPPLSTTEDYVLLSDADTDTDVLCVELTSNTTAQTGCAWDANSSVDFSEDFTYDYVVNMGTSDGGADGMAFVLHDDPQALCACGGSGGGFAALGIQNSLIIELDTYLNTEDRDDGPLMAAEGVSCFGIPAPDHLDIWINGDVNPLGADCSSAPGARVVPSAVPLKAGASLYNIENGLDHLFRVDWDFDNQEITVSVLSLDESSTYGSISYVFDPIALFGTNRPYFGFTASTGGFSNQQTFCNPPSLLPVELVNFSTDCHADGVELKWSTASEKQNELFEILRSDDGVDFFVIDTVYGSGTTSEYQEYSFIDFKTRSASAYYTLNQIDINGKVNETGFVRVVECERKEEFAIYPNPLQVGQSIQVDLNGAANGQLRISDHLGALIGTQTLRDNSQIEISSQLAPGYYLLELTTDASFQPIVRRLVVIE